MPRPHLRTRSKKRLKVTLPSGRSQIHYEKEIVPTPSCSMCGQQLSGMQHLTPVEIRKLNRSKRRIGRPYGGQLCGKCLKNALKQAARAK
ncbi:MAG: 50S ribosomal protein L34e [Candidatus Bathyarchaeota archaeon]|nr:50S ribosomal protein L34e [Candidatus Bathyarchaeota archaeon]MDH5787406.1 50S ribosomal protein L34e [Candidatus Bathyarchaeota archaeon]